MLLTGIYLAKKDKVNFWKMGDIIMSAVPFGYTLGRLGNFINGELYGRVTTSSWGMYFPKDPTCLLRHPSQLYEAFFEGLLLFLILWSLRKTKILDGFIFLLYFIGYGVARFFIEYIREPDSQLRFVLGDFTMGQILSICMVLGGVCTMLIRIRQTKKQLSIT
jgi:phosphatidylglycerol:prolipoprotein diacylglycerol transferase